MGLNKVMRFFQNIHLYIQSTLIQCDLYRVVLKDTQRRLLAGIYSEPYLKFSGIRLHKAMIISAYRRTTTALIISGYRRTKIGALDVN